MTGSDRLDRVWSLTRIQYDMEEIELQIREDIRKTTREVEVQGDMTGTGIVRLQCVTDTGEIGNKIFSGMATEAKTRNGIAFHLENIF